MTAPLATSETEAGCTTCKSRKNGLCGRLSDQVRERVAARAQIVSYPANRRICGGEGDSSDVVILRSGYVRTQHHTLSGRRQIMAIARPGQTVGQENEERNEHEIEAITPVSVCRLERLEFEQLLSREPGLCGALCNQMVTRLDEARRLTWILGALESNQRLRAFLLLSRNWMDWAPQPDGTGVLTMILPRRDIADLLATTPETISRLLRQLHAQGLIEILSPRQFRLCDIPGLADGLDMVIPL